MNTYFWLGQPFPSVLFNATVSLSGDNRSTEEIAAMPLIQYAADSDCDPEAPESNAAQSFAEATMNDGYLIQKGQVLDASTWRMALADVHPETTAVAVPTDVMAINVDQGDAKQVKQRTSSFGTYQRKPKLPIPSKLANIRWSRPVKPL